MEILAKITKALAAMSSAEVMALALKSGVSYFTIQKIRSGETKNPTINTCEALHKAIKK